MALNPDPTGATVEAEVDKPLKPCPEPGCPNLVRTGRNRSARCPQHTTAKVYDRAWTTVRLAKLRADPVCQRCHLVLAAEVDHIVPVKAGGARLDPRNLRSLCVACHRAVTPREYTFRPAANYRRSRERVNRGR